MTQAEEDHAGHVVSRTVAASPRHLPFRPDRVAIRAAARHAHRNIGHKMEHLLPIEPHLLSAGKVALRMNRGLITVVRRETVHQRIQVMGIGGSYQALNHAIHYSSMERNSHPVKQTRRYDSSGRRKHARDTREAIVRSARELFLRDGYAATTVAAIAAAAGVSVETIYKAFGGKPGLVRAIVERALAGEGPEPAEQRSDLIRETERDARKIVAAWGEFTAEIGPRVMPILRLAREAAATDPEMAAALEQINAERLERMAFNARRLHAAGHLRPDVSARQAADILWTCSSAELYELLVLRRGWTPRRFGRFVGEVMAGALLPRDQQAAEENGRT